MPREQRHACGHRRSSAAPSGSAPAPAPGQSQALRHARRSPRAPAPVSDQALVAVAPCPRRRLHRRARPRTRRAPRRRRCCDRPRSRGTVAPGPRREGRGELFLRRVEAEQQHAVAPGIAPLDRRDTIARHDASLCGCSFHHAGRTPQVIEAGQRARRILVVGARPGGRMISSSSSRPSAIAVRVQRLQAFLLRWRNSRGSSG